MADQQQRLVDIEEKIAYLEQTVSDLDEVVQNLNSNLGEYRKEVDGVARRVTALLEQQNDEGTEGEYDG